MSEYDNSNRFALWLQSDRPSDRHPFAKGKIELGDDIVEAVKSGQREFQLSAWKGEAEGNRPAISGQIQLPFVAAGVSSSKDEITDF